MAEEKFIQANGLQFHTLDWGGHGEWVVLLHGLASQAHILDLVAPQLSESLRVIAIDQRGHGLSDKPDAGYDFASITHDLDQLLTVLDIERATLIGHSWGGNVAVQYAVDHPQREWSGTGGWRFLADSRPCRLAHCREDAGTARFDPAYRLRNFAPI